MAHPLQQRVEIVRRKAARMLRWIAACRIISLLLATLVLLGTLDYFTRSEEPVVRWLLSAIVAAAVVAAVWRWGWPVAQITATPIATALRIEQRFPALKNRLSNSIAFAENQEQDLKAGSLVLRRAVIAETDALATHIDFRQALDRRPLRRSASLLGASLVLLSVVAVLFPLSTGIALRRVLAPWSSVRWPLHHSLAFVEAPTRLALGADFEAQVVDRNGRLPDNVRLLLRYDQRTETIEMKPVSGRMVHRLENVTESFAYKAVGGDDRTMPWTEVEVLEAPKVAEFTLNVRPPEYTGWPDEKLERVARVLAGSRLVLTGKLDKAASAVRLSAAGQSPLVLEADLSDDGRSFTIPSNTGPQWIADKSGSFSFELLDESGIKGGQETRIELQVVADAPPAIAWETPTDQTFVTPRGTIPVRALVKDDLAMDRIVLKYLPPGATEEPEQVIELHAADRSKGAAAIGQVKGRKGDGESLQIDSAWDLAALRLQPGDVLAVRLEATDFKPQASTTPLRRISVIDHADFENRMLQQQTSVFTQLGEALRLQQEAHGQISLLRIQLDETHALQPRDIDQLQGGELLQRQVQRLLSDPSDGVDARLSQLLAELTNNGLEDEAIGRRMVDLQKHVRQINQDMLLDISQQLTVALKAARSVDSDRSTALPAADLAAVASPLAAATTGQQGVIDRLEELLADLSEWDSFSRLAREVGQIREQQSKVRKETESLRWKIAAASGEQPTPEHRAAARQFASRQQDLARRFDKLQGRVDELRSRIESADPQTARTLAEASELGRRLAIGGQMRQAGRELTEYRVGAGQQTQERVLESLGQLLDALSSRRDRELQRTVESLQAVRSELDQLRAQQRQLAELAAEAASQPDEQERRRQLMRLAREQEELAKKSEEMRRKLERLQAKRPAQSAGKGIQSMEQAGKAASSGDGGQAAEQTREASRLLDEAREQLQREIEQVQADLVREQLTRLEQSLEAIIVRQKSVLAEIERLEQLRQADGSLPAAQQSTLGGVAAEQHLLAEEAEQLRLKLTDSPAFSLALEGVRREMLRAADLLGQGKTDASTSERAKAALERLEQALAVLKEDSADAPAGDDQQGGGSGDDASSGESLVRSLAELRLLAELQATINRRTADIEAQRQQNGELTPDQQTELASLSAEQGKLAEMVMELAGKAKTSEAEVPAIPTIDEDGADKPERKPGETPSLDEQLLRDLLEMP